MQSIILGFVVVLASFGQLSWASSADDALKQKMLRDLDFIQNVYESRYAPASWKKQYAGWDLESEIGAAKSSVLESCSPSVKSYQRILRQFFNSTKDYHVSIDFFSTEKARLPFTVRGANGKYFLVNIDRSKLPESSFPFDIGDEIVRFGDQTTDEAVQEVRTVFGNNSPLTDQALAELYLTRRSGRVAMVVPNGPITLAILPKGSDRLSTYQLVWDYSPERLRYDFNSDRNKMAEHKMPKGLFANRSMLSPQADLLRSINSDTKADNPYLPGSRESFMPQLGIKVWESSEKDVFDAYVFQADDRRLIGYVRIPDYTPENADNAANEFKRRMGYFEAITDALVIDQVNNPGGSVFYLYALASALTDQALHTPLHRQTITQEDVNDALSLIGEIGGVTTDEEARKVFGDTVGGYPVSYEFVRLTLDFARFIVSEWEAGRRVTEPFYLYGVDKINPSSTRYTKPILLLVNALDFSGGDFFPAILQDNKRVTILGTRTAGAGGYVLDVKYPNAFGVQQFTVTGSIAKRLDQNPIENLGVKPDIEYSLTEKDLQSGFPDYLKAVRAALSGIVK